MKKAVFALILFFFTMPVYPQSEPEKNYMQIELAYIDWEKPIYGGGKFFRRELVSLLNSLYRKKIVTGYDYVLVQPFSSDATKYYCRFTVANGISVQAELPAEKIKTLKGDSTGALWTSRKLAAISGILRKFYLADSPGGIDLLLYLDDADILFLN